MLLTHSLPWNEALVPCGCVHDAHGTRPSFCELYFCCLGKHSQTDISFKMNFLLMKEENFITYCCIVLMFKLVEI